MRIIFVRHCEPDYEIDSLTKKGWREAELLAKRVLNWDVKDFYVSPLGRAQDTARVCLDLRAKEGRNADFTTKEWLKEFYFNLTDPEDNKPHKCWDLMPSYYSPYDELHNHKSWCDSPLMKSGDIRGKYEAVARPFDELLATYGYERQEDGTYKVTNSNEDTIVMFCHFGITGLLTGHLTGIAPPQIWQGFCMAPSSVTVIGTEECEKGIASFRVQQFGSVSHLTGAGEPVSSMGYFAEVLSV